MSGLEKAPQRGDEATISTGAPDRSRRLANAVVAIARAASLKDVLVAVTQQAVALIGVHQAVTSLPDGGDWTRTVSHTELSEKYAAWRDYDVKSDGSGIYSLVCESNRPLRLTQAELEAHPRWRGFGGEAHAHPPMAGWLAVPMVGREGDNLGLIQLSDKFEGEFTDEDEAILVQLAEVATTAVENAQLREALEEANRRANERAQELEAVMDALPAAVWIAHDREATRITGSRASYAMLRLPYGVNASLSAEAGTAPTNFRVMRDGRELRPEELPVQQAALQGRSLEDFQEQIVFDDGEVRHLYGNATPLLAADGTVRGAVAAFLDVTRLKNVERAMGESEERTRLALTATGMATWEIHAQTREARCSDDLGPLYGKRPGFSFATMEDWLAAVHPDDRERVAAARHRLFEEGTPIDDEFRVVKPDGEIAWLHSKASMFRDADGLPWKAVGVVSDITARKRFEGQVQLGTERYRALAEAAASVVFSADAEGRLTSLPLVRGLDPSFAETGLGTGWTDLIHPDDRAAATEAWDRAIATQTPYETEFRLRMRGGDYRWHVARGVPVGDHDGLPREWIGACLDVHERITTERTLRLVNDLTAATRTARDPQEVITESQRLLGEHLGVSRCAYGLPTEGGRRFDMPPNYCVGCEDMSGKFPISGYASRTSVALRAGVTVVVHDVATEMTPPEGRDAYLDASIAAIIAVPVMKDGKVVAMLGVHQNRPRLWSSDEVELVRNVAERTYSEMERVRAEYAVQRSEQRLRETLEAATVGVVLNDVAGRFLYANEPLLRLLGYSERDLEEGVISWSVIQAPELLARDDRALEQLRAKGTCDPYETEFIARDGRRIPVYVGAALVPDTDGPGQLGAAFVTDLTALKQAERELVRLNADLERRVVARTAELEAANREMEGFNYTVAHDLRAPLRAIISTAKILDEEAGETISRDHRRLLERQAANATHLARLLDDLLIYSRISRQEVRRQRVDLSELAERVADGVREEHPNVISIEPGLTASADPGLLRLVLQNLLENGCKFSPGGGLVRFGREETPRGPAFFVRDEGVGFDMAHSRKLFEPFERLVRQDEFPGTGIGLANVKRVVERHGGTIWADSRPGEGATFWFTLRTEED
ncbi:MAG: PAS domain-containing protein [Fimbriimonas sp.]